MRTIDDIFASENADENLDLMRLFNEDANQQPQKNKDEENEAEECGKKCCQDLAFENFQFDEMSFLADTEDVIEDDAKSGAKADVSDLEKEDKDDKDDKKDDDKEDDDDKKDDDKKDDDKKDDDKDDDDDKKDDDKGEKADGDECFKFESVEADFLSNEEYFDIFNDDVAPATNVNDPQDDVEHPEENDDDDDEDDDDKKDKKEDDEPAKDEVVGLGDSDSDLDSALFAFMDDDLI